MKKIITIMLSLIVAAILIVGVVLSIPPKTVDFRGIIVDIQQENDLLIFTLDGGNDTVYTVIADEKTVVKIHDSNTEISLVELSLDNCIQGNYKKDNYSSKLILLY